MIGFSTNFNNSGNAEAASLDVVLGVGNVSNKNIKVKSLELFKFINPFLRFDLEDYSSIKAILKATNITNQVTLEFPDKQGSFTIATTDDIGGNWDSINAANEVYSDSLIDETITGMTITPIAGTYKIDFNGNYDVIPGNVCTIATLDLQNLYLKLLNTPATATHGLTFGSGETITAGVYSVAGAMSVAGTLTLDGGGDPNALFLFRVTGAINTAIATTIQLSNEANAANVFFMAVGAVGIGADNVISGNYIAYGAAAALGANCIFNGRMFSTSGALAFSSGVQSKPIRKSVIEMGILENFLCFTNQGNVANTALAVITGDLGTNFGNVTIFATSVFNGNGYDDTQQLGSTNVFSLYSDTTIIENSSRTRRYYNYTEDVSLQGIVTVDGNQPISVKWRTDVGRVLMNNRILTVTKL